MDTQSKYRVVFYVNTEEEIKNLLTGAVLTGAVNTEHYNFEILKNATEQIT